MAVVVTGVAMPLAAAAALDHPARLIIVSAPPGLGARDVVTSWAERSGLPYATVAPEASGFGATGPDALLSVVDDSLGHGVLIVFDAHRLTLDQLQQLTESSPWRVIAVDDLDTYDGGGVVPVFHGRDLLAGVGDVTVWLPSGGGSIDGEMVMKATHGWPALTAVVADHVERSSGEVDPESVRYALRDRMRRGTASWARALDPDLLDRWAVAEKLALEEIEADRTAGHASTVDRLLRAGVLAEATDQGRPVVRLLPPLAEVLRDDLARDRTRHRSVLRDLAASRHASGVVDSGLGAAFELGDWPLCQRIIERWWFQNSFYGDRGLQHRVLMSMPTELLGRSPICSSLAGLMGIVADGGVAPLIPDRAPDIERLATSDQLRAFMEHAVLAMIARRWHGRLEAASSIATRAATVLEHSTYAHVSGGRAAGVGSSVADFKTYWYLQAGLTCALGDDPVDALRFYRSAWREHEWDSSGFASRDVALKLAIHHQVAGDRAEAARWSQIAQESTSTSRNALRYICRDLGLVRAMAALDSAEPQAVATARNHIADISTRNELWPFVLWTQVRQALLEGATRRAQQLLSDAPAHHRLTINSDGLHGAVVRMLQVEVHLALGHGNRAEQVMRRGVATAHFGRVTEARFAYLTGDMETAQELASEAVWNPTSSVRTQAEAGLILAAAELAAGRRDEAVVTAVRALRTIEASTLGIATLALPRAGIDALADLDASTAGLRVVRDGIALADIYPAHVEIVRLTDRERVVLDALASGATVATIAESLYVSEHTVKSQRRTLFAKLGARRRADAVRRGRELGLLSN